MGILSPCQKAALYLKIHLHDKVFHNNEIEFPLNVVAECKPLHRLLRRAIFQQQTSSQRLLLKLECMFPELKTFVLQYQRHYSEQKILIDKIGGLQEAIRCAKRHLTQILLSHSQILLSHSR